MRPGEHSSGLPEVEAASLAAGAQAAAAAVQLQRQAVAVLVETVVDAEVYQVIVQVIAAAGRSGVEKVYGAPYLDVGCDVWFDVCRIHHFSPLITAIRRGLYQWRLSLSIPLPQDLDRPEWPFSKATPSCWGCATTKP